MERNHSSMEKVWLAHKYSTCCACGLSAPSPSIIKLDRIGWLITNLEDEKKNLALWETYGGQVKKQRKCINSKREGFVYKWLQTQTPRPEREGPRSVEGLGDMVEDGTFCGCTWVDRHNLNPRWRLSWPLCRYLFGRQGCWTY